MSLLSLSPPPLPLSLSLVENPPTSASELYVYTSLVVVVTLLCFEYVEVVGDSSSAVSADADMGFDMVLGKRGKTLLRLLFCRRQRADGVTVTCHKVVVFEEYDYF